MTAGPQLAHSGTAAAGPARRASREVVAGLRRALQEPVVSSTGSSSSWAAAATGSGAFPQPSASELPEPRSSLDHAHFRRGPPEPRRVRRFSSVHFRPRTLPACVPETRVPGAHPQPRAFPACQALTTKMERPPALWRRADYGGPPFRPLSSLLHIRMRATATPWAGLEVLALASVSPLSNTDGDHREVRREAALK